MCCSIRQPGRESGSSNGAIRSPRDPIDLFIDPLLPQLVQTTARVYTATTGKSSEMLQARAHATAEDGHVEPLTLHSESHWESKFEELVILVSSFHTSSIPSPSLLSFTSTRSL